MKGHAFTFLRVRRHSPNAIPVRYSGEVVLKFYSILSGHCLAIDYAIIGEKSHSEGPIQKGELFKKIDEWLIVKEPEKDMH